MPTIVTRYQVNDGQPLLLDVLIGDLQPGGTTVFVGQQRVVTGEGDLVDVGLGPGERLRGQAMVISTVVVDRNPLTDFTSTVVSLDGGNHMHVDIPQSESVPTGGAASFLTVVHFV